MTVTIYTHPSGIEHDTGPGHPENSGRLVAILDEINKNPSTLWELREAPKASVEQIALVHDEAYIQKILDAVPKKGLFSLDGETVLSPSSGEAALRQSGAVCAAVDQVLGSGPSKAFCLMRPPGHHAEPAQAMGFCIFNGIGVGAAHALSHHRLKRVAIFDFDVHHGNGSQAMFWDNPAVLYLSMHQMPLYPGTGSRQERGNHHNIVNVPIRPLTAGTSWRQAFDAEIATAINGFEPDLILISAGFDAHQADPLAQLLLDEEDFAWVTERLVSLSDENCQGRLISVLEGGYDHNATARSVLAHLKAMASNS